MQLSILDFSHPSWTVELAEQASQIGYSRYWIGEHHSPEQCSNPLLLGAILALANTGLRFGSGGVCLGFHSPLQIAEDARLIEALVPNRFDLGITKGLMTNESVARALLDGRDPLSDSQFLEKASKLYQSLTGGLGNSKTTRTQAPPLWLLGLSKKSARWAAEHGTGLCLSLHHGTRSGVRDSIDEYLGQFRPSPFFPEPSTIVVVSGVCAPSQREVKVWEKGKKSRPEGPLAIGNTAWPNRICGTPEEFVGKIYDIHRELGVEEVMILDLVQGGISERLQMYQLIANEAGIGKKK